MLKSASNRWGSLAKFFHWTIVLLILVQGTIGLVMVELPKTPSVIPVFSLHKSLGLTILTLAILRLTWRAFDPRPAEPTFALQVLWPDGDTRSVYALLFPMPLTGWWFDSLSGLRPLYYFALFEYAPGADKE